METDRFVGRWLGAERDSTELRVLARDVGHELLRNDLEQIRDLLERLGPTAERVKDAFVSGFRVALIECLSAFEVGLEDQLSRRDAEQEALREGWHRVLELLAPEPMGPTALAKRIGVSVSAASKTLDRMRRAHLVERGRAPDAKARPHRLTLQGKRLVKQIGPSFADAVLFEFEELRRAAKRPFISDLPRPDMRECHIAALHMAVGVLAKPLDRMALVAARELAKFLVELSQGVVPCSEDPTPRAEPEGGPTVELIRFMRRYLAASAELAAEVESRARTSGDEGADDRMRSPTLLALGESISERGSGEALAWGILAIRVAQGTASPVVRNELFARATLLTQESDFPLALYCQGQLAAHQREEPQRYEELVRKLDAAHAGEWRKDTPDDLHEELTHASKILLSALHPLSEQFASPVVTESGSPRSPILIGVPKNASGDPFVEALSGHSNFKLVSLVSGAEVYEQLRHKRIRGGVLAHHLALALERDGYVISGYAQPLQIEGVMGVTDHQRWNDLRLGYPRGSAIREHVERKVGDILPQNWVPYDADSPEELAQVAASELRNKAIAGFIAWHPITPRIMALLADVEPFKELAFGTLPMVMVIRDPGVNDLYSLNQIEKRQLVRKPVGTFRTSPKDFVSNASSAVHASFA